MDTVSLCRELFMTRLRHIHWQDGGYHLGYLEDYPDYLTQGRSAEELLRWHNVEGPPRARATERRRPRAIGIQDAAHLDPPHVFDKPRELHSNEGKVRSSVRGLTDAVEQLAAPSRPFLNWAGKAERLSFDVPDEGLASQVQAIYMDPPYGVKVGSNFQPFVRSDTCGTACSWRGS
jgi:hypothetical protein